MAMPRVLVTGAAGFIASYIMPGLRGRYDLTLLDVRDVDREGGRVEGVVTADLTDLDRSGFQHHFEGIDAVIHLGHKSRRQEPLDDFHDEIDNVRMVYNVLRCAYDASVPRVAVGSSNHAADWYEHALIHERKMEVLDPYAHPLSDNFYGWAKASYEHLGFLFACGFPVFQDASGREIHVSPKPGPRRLEVVNVRIGAPREIDASNFEGDPAGYKRDLGAYVSDRDLAQLFRRAIETPDIENEHGIPWQVVYGISGNTRAFWSLSNARSVLGYEPEDDSEVRFAGDIQALLGGSGAAGRLGV